MSIVFKIATVDKTSTVKALSVKKTDRINDRNETLTFKLKKTPDRTFVPALADEIDITVNGSDFFKGVIVSRSQRAITPDTVEYSFKAVGFKFYLDRHLVTQRYTNQTVASIIADLIANDTEAGDSFTTNNVIANQTVTSIAFNRISVSKAIQKLADLVNYSWYVDYDRDVHFFAKESLSSALDLTDSSDNYHKKTLTVFQDISQIRNTIIVEGGEIEGNSRTVEQDGDTVKATFDTIYKFSEKPTVTVDSIAQTVGLDHVDDDLSFDCMWDFNQKYIRFTAGNTPGSGTRNVDITGTPLFPILVNVPDNISVDTFGPYEHSIKETTIRSQDEAIERAISENRAYAESLIEGSFITNTEGIRAGMVINLNSTLHGINDDLLIQKVTMRMATSDATRNTYEVEFATLKTLGIVDILQKLLQDEEITENEQITLLTFLQVEDSFTMGDVLSAPTQTSGPYVYAVSGGNTTTWNFSTYSNT